MLARAKFFLISSIIFKAVAILPRAEKPKIIAIIFLQIGLGFLDLLGIAAMGVLGALAVTRVQSQQPGNRIPEFI
jgi:hypothetical protein